jgi:Tol biopolymer transport system component
VLRLRGEGRGHTYIEEETVKGGGVLVFVCLAAVCCLLTSPLAADNVTTRLSVDRAGNQIPLPSSWPSMSADGRFVAFQSLAETVVPGDTNWVYDIYVRDRVFGISRIASLSSAGALGDRQSLYPSISADGKVVAFVSTATNFAAGTGDGIRQVYVHELETGLTELVSVSTSGEPADADCVRPSVSGDGRFVVFRSGATDLVAGAPAEEAIYLRDRLAGTTELMSASAEGEAGNALSFSPTITPDGRYVAFYSYAQNLVAEDENPSADVFVRDREAGTVEIVSLADGTGAAADAACSGARPAITPDGRFVAFASQADNLVPGDVNGAWDVFVRDRQTGATELVSVSSSGAQGDAASGYEAYSLAISADGRFVVFPSLADNLAAGDTNGAWDVFVRDRQLGTTVRASVSAIGGIGNDDSGYYGISASADGRYVTYDSLASDLVANDTNGWDDVFLWGPAGGPTQPAMVIDDDNTFTNAREVELTVEPAGCTALRFRDESGDWTDWMPSATEVNWVLPEGDGRKVVVGQGRFADTSLSDEFSDAIILDTVAPTAPAIAVNDGAEVATDLKVVLTVTASDAAQVRFRNEPGDWSPWQYFTGTKPWTLLPGNGTKRVYAQVRDAAGNPSPEAWDEITLDTGAPSELSISINGGAAETDSPEVQLALTAVDATEMRFRNESSDWSEWEPFAEGRAWTLSAVDGDKIVYFQTRDAFANESLEVWDDIILDTAPPAGLSISIDAGAETTRSHRVTLSLAASDAASMRFHNESGDWSEWEPFAATKAWVLSSADGVKTVGFQCQDAAGNVSAEAADTIMLAGFSDVASDFWAYAQIRACVDAGVVQGYADGTYGPAIPVSRDQMAVYISRALAGGDAAVPPGPVTATFEDVPNTGLGESGTDPFWAYKYIEYCVALGVVQGYDATHYGPAIAVTRDQMAVFIARAKGWLKLGDDMTTAPEIFSDVPAGFWAGGAIQACRDRGVVLGHGDGTYGPEDEVTRDQMAVFIQRAFELPVL